MEHASLRYGPAVDRSASASLSSSFERHLRAKSLSDGTVASYLVGLRQFTAFLHHGRELIQATRADLEAFIGGLLVRWSPATASTRYEQRWGCGRLVLQPHLVAGGQEPGSCGRASRSCLRLRRSRVIERRTARPSSGVTSA
jgi:hypothetical protein